MRVHCTPPERLKNRSWNDVVRMLYTGDITPSEWDIYYCAWHRMSPRFSSAYVKACERCGAEAEVRE